MKKVFEQTFAQHPQHFSQCLEDLHWQDLGNEVGRLVKRVLPILLPHWIPFVFAPSSKIILKEDILFIFTFTKKELLQHLGHGQ